MTEVVVTANKPYIEVMKTAVSSVNRPIRFVGSKEEAEANFKSHDFRVFDGEALCLGCDCKPHHAHASYPCGVEAPRETETVWNDGTVTTVPE